MDSGKSFPNLREDLVAGGWIRTSDPAGVFAWSDYLNVHCEICRKSFGSALIMELHAAPCIRHTLHAHIGNCCMLPVRPQHHMQTGSILLPALVEKTISTRRESTLLL